MWNKFLDSVSRFIDDECRLSREALHIVALSGGADSVCLLRAMLELGYSVEAAHCNFHLRGEESQRDEAFAEDLCKSLGVSLHRAHFDTKEYAKLHKVSIEMAARELRYSYFEQLRLDMGADDILVAHHRDDSVETVVLNLIRGTGLRGLKGIAPRNGHIVRPLLCVGREEIGAWLKELGQDYMTDSTNLHADAATRNKIRLQLLPLMREINPAAGRSIDKTAHRLAEVERRLNGQMSAELHLFEVLRPLGFSPATIEQIASWKGTDTGRCWQSPTHTLVSDRGRLMAEPTPKPIQPITIPETGCYIVDGCRTLRVSIEEGRNVSRSADVATLDAALATFPLTLRQTAEGDRFAPLGMRHGTKLVSDYLTDRKVNLLAKRRQLVLADSSGRIVWLANQRPDERCRVTEATTRTLVCSLPPLKTDTIYV